MQSSDTEGYKRADDVRMARRFQRIHNHRQPEKKCRKSEDRLQRRLRLEAADLECRQARVMACVLRVWVVLWTTSAMTTTQALDSDLADAEIGPLQDGGVEVFSGSEVASPPPGTKPPSNQMKFLNGAFELTNLTTNGTQLALPGDTTLIPNWLPGGAGVQIVQSSTYQMSNFAPSVFAIHLNNPNSAGNSTQGSVLSKNFTWAPKPATLYTAQFDCARLPDGPLNLFPAMKVSSMSGSVMNYFALHRPRYNISDTPQQITWTRHSFLFMGTGANTSLLFESMSEKYGPVIDNVDILSGIHILHPNSAPATPIALCLRHLLLLGSCWCMWISELTL